MPIRTLPPEVASQIAAGEVVERPASAVKELVENSLDAHAHAIIVEVDEGGQRSLRVSDDGDGIAPAEMRLAVERHATSKLQSAEDLQRIQYYGFRGEALASIAAVSRFTLISRAAGETNGMRLIVEGGRLGAEEPVGAPQGTVAQAEDLFFNVPARLKFLKSQNTERRQIESLLARFNLARADVRYKLIQDGRETFRGAGSGDRREALAGIFGLEAAERMLDISDPLSDSQIHISGFLGPTDLSRSHRRDILLFINGRSVANASLAAAVIQAYHSLLMVGRYPLAAVFIDLPTEEVDVNVHPAKAEVRFRSADSVFAAVQRAARQTLLAVSPVPAWRASPWADAGGAASPEKTFHPDWQFADDKPLLDDHKKATVAPSEPLRQAGVPRTPLLRAIGQIGLTYLVAEGPDGLYLIDQHAAHERILFEEMRGSAGSLPMQALLSPEMVGLTGAEASLLTGQLPLLERLGFQIEPFGGSAFRVRAIPALLSKMNASEALHAVVEDIEEDETPLEAEAEARLAARICKRAAVKAGQVLGAREQEELLRKLEACESPRTCPHGRPTMIHLSVDSLERQFGRRG
jgi:DNA mismatch repair protein MutL